MRPRILALGEEKYREIARLAKQAIRAGQFRVEVRLTAVLRNSKGETSGQLARKLGVSRSKVSAWLASFEKYGIQGVLEGKRSGRPPRLTPRKLKKLWRIYEMGPAEYSRQKWGSNQRDWIRDWTFPMLANVIEQEFGIYYQPGGVRALLYRKATVKDDRWHRREPLSRSPGPGTERTGPA